MNEEEIAKCKINARELPVLPDGYTPPPGFRPQQARRSMTPKGFAQAFYEANK
jgi:hypothetical protein